MSKRPSFEIKKWMPLYVGEHLSATGHMTNLQFAAYTRLKMHYWWSQKPLPDVDATLALITKTTLKEWKSCRPAIAPLFQIIDEKWFDSELADEIEKAALLSKKRQELGVLGAKKRWGGANNG